jgi:gas vesicle protein
MAYEYDRFEREEGGGSFLMGLLAGTVLGAGLGMLFAPKAGSELRSQLADQTGRLRDAAEPVYQQATEKVSQIVDRGREAYDRARSSVSNMATTGTSGSTTSSAAPQTPGTPGTAGTTGTTGSTGKIGTTSTPGGSYGA